MSSSLHQTVLVPVALGEASSFKRAISPLSLYRKGDSLDRGDLFLHATLNEMRKIIEIATNPQQWQELIAATKARYDQLMLQKAELEQRSKSKNPLKAFAKHRAARMFLVGSQSLYIETKSRSESIVRSSLSIQGEGVQQVDSDVPPDANIAGLVVRLDHPLDDTARQQMLDAANAIASFSGPFEGDQAISDANNFPSDEYILTSESLTSLVSSTTGETLDDTILPLPLSSPTNFHFNFYASVDSPHSNVDGATVQVGGDHNSSSVTHTISPPNAA